MLVVKTGTVRRGVENPFYKSLVWIGAPANIASRLTDNANKTLSKSVSAIQEGYWDSLRQTSVWSKPITQNDFLEKLKPTYQGPYLQHATSQSFFSFIKTELESSTTYPPILVTKDVFHGFYRERPLDPSFVGRWWVNAGPIEEHESDAFGVNFIFKIVSEIV